MAEHSEKELNMYLYAVTHRKKIGTTRFWIAYTMDAVRAFAKESYLTRKLYRILRQVDK
jgi:hypothetical protein